MVTTSEPILSKTIHPDDLAELELPLQAVEMFFTAATPQHPQRRWEYAMALRAATVWMALRGRPITHALDVGGAGSPFALMLDAWGAHAVTTIDPLAAEQAEQPVFMAMPTYRVVATSLSQYVRLKPPPVPAVFCISVLEHVEDVMRFCNDLAAMVAPGGLLFLTVDYCDALEVCPKDRYELHWMRERIFTARSLANVSAEFFWNQFQLLGAADFTWHGPQVYDYTFASLAFVKAP